MFELPAGRPIEIEFLAERKPNQRGLVDGPIDFDARGFEFVALTVPAELGFGEPFRIECERRWINLSGVAEVRYLPENALRDEIARLAALHERVQAGMARS